MQRWCGGSRRCGGGRGNQKRPATRNWGVEVKARRVGGSTYQVPIEIRAYRGTNISLKWITEFARERSGKSMAMKLSNEILDAAKETGNSIRKKEQTHKAADANKAFAHFRY